MPYLRLLCSAAITSGLVAFQVLSLETAVHGQNEELAISRLSIPLEKDAKPFCASETEDGRLLAFQIDHPEGRGKLDIWFSRLENGRWSVPFNAGPQVNTGSHEADAKLSADGTVMVFLRSDDFSKSSRVYVSQFRDGSWSTGQLLGPPVSLPDTVQFGALLSKDLRRLYFSSNRPGGQGDSTSTPAIVSAPVGTSGESPSTWARSSTAPATKTTWPSIPTKPRSSFHCGGMIR